MQDGARNGCDNAVQRPSLDVTNIQSYLALKKQLSKTISHIRKLQDHASLVK